MKTSIIVAAIVLIVVVAGVGGLLYYSGVISPPLQNVTVRIGYLQGDLHQLSFQIALANGYYTQRGIQVVKTQYLNGPSLMQDLVAGNLDFGYVGVVPAMQARANAMTSSNATAIPVVVGSVNQEGSEIVVDSSKIPNLQALNGSTIGTPGVGTIQDMLLTIYAQSHNLTITKYASTNPNLVIQFEAHAFDGFIAWEPTPTKGILLANGTALLNSRDIMPGHQCCVLVVSDKFLAAHPDIVSEVVAAHDQAMDFINSNPEGAKVIAMNYTGLSADIINQAFSDILYSKTLNVTSIRTFLVDKIELGQITTVNLTQVDSFMNGFINTQYVH